MGGRGSGRRPNERDEQTMRQLREAVQREDRAAIEESKRRAKQMFADRQKGGKK